MEDGGGTYVCWQALGLIPVLVLKAFLLLFSLGKPWPYTFTSQNHDFTSTKNEKDDFCWLS